MKLLLFEEQKGAVYAILSGLLYGLLGYFGVTLMKNGFSVYNMAFWRFVVASAFMLIILIKNKNILSIFSKNSFKILMFGMLFYAPSTILYFISSKYIGTGQAMVIFFSYPAIVMILNVLFYKSHINKIDCFALLMIGTGMLCLIDLHEFKFDLLGIVFGVLGAVAYACYMIKTKSAVTSPDISTFMVSFGCMLTCAIFGYFDHTLTIPNQANDWINILGISLICTTLPILLLLRSLKYISSEKASMLSVLEPVFVLIFGMLFLNEKVNNSQIIGIMVVLTGSLVTLFSNKINERKRKRIQIV